MDTQLLIMLIFVIGVGLAVGFGLRWLVQGGKRLEAEQKARLARSQSAHAKVLQLGKSVAQARNGLVVIKLRLEVTPPNAAPYQVSTVWAVQMGNLPQIQPEQQVAVKIDPDNAEVIYPNVGWAEFSKFYWEAWVQDKQKRRKDGA